MAFKLTVVLATILLVASAPVPEEKNDILTTLAPVKARAYVIETVYEVIKINPIPVDNFAATKETGEAIEQDKEVKTTRDTSDEENTPEHIPEEAEKVEDTKTPEVTKEQKEFKTEEDITKHVISKRSALRSDNSNNDLLAAGDALRFDSIGESSIIGHKIRFLPTWAG